MADNESQAGSGHPSDTLDLGARIRPIPPEGIFRDEEYFVWCPCVVKGDDGRYYLVHSRWPRTTGFGGWLTDSEVALARADRPEGPYVYRKTLARGRGPGHWDELMAHNPKLEKFGDRYYLYYISSRSGPTRWHIRHSQRTGVAVAQTIEGPYEPLAAPVAEPSAPVFNVAVNPGVVQTPDGRYLMILKGDIEPRRPDEPMPRRIQGMALADSPTGPFRILPEPAISDIDTEDASIWRDAARGLYYAIFHAHTYLGLIVSPDGRRWSRAAHYVVTDKRLRLADGSIFEAERLERPFVFFEDGRPRLLCMAAKRGSDSYCLLAPLA